MIFAKFSSKIGLKLFLNPKFQNFRIRLLARKFQMRGNISGRQRLVMSALRVMLKQVVEAVRSWDLSTSEANSIRAGVNDMKESFALFAETGDERDLIMGLIAEIAYSAQRRVAS